MAWPEILSGQRITGTLLTNLMPVTAIKTASTSRTSTTTITADPELQLSVEAGAEYVGEFYFRISGNSAGDMDVQWTTPAGATGSWNGYRLLAASADGGTGTTVRAALNAEISLSTPSPTTAQAVTGTFRITMGGTSGTLSIDWAQGTSNATATVMESDSYIKMRRVA
jgi:hypothetical protein